MKENVLNILLEHGTLVEPDAIDFILAQKDPKGFVTDFLAAREALPLVLTVDDLRSTESVLSFDEEIEQVEVEKMAVEPQPVIDEVQISPLETEDEPPEPAVSSELIIVTDITGCSTCEGKIENFARYFKDRYMTLSRLIKLWQKMRGGVSIESAKKREDEVKITGMVSDVGHTKNGHTTVNLEDDTGTIFVLIPKVNPLQSIPIVKDEVIGIAGKVKNRKSNFRGSKDTLMMLPDEIVKPDIPVNRKPVRSQEDIEVLFLSDIHVGSSHFLHEEWKKMTGWLNEGDDVGNIKYAVVSGDLVDGIGIYPNQIDELDITNIEEQYTALSELLSEFPDSIEIILQPGNHDAVRAAEPQPALDEELRSLIKGDHKFVGNPCFMTIGGVGILSYHGRSVDDFIGAVPALTYQTPIKAMREMLKRRHLAPIYGGKTPIAPEDKDYLVINPVPDIFVTGHVHGAGVDTYRGVTIINASAWQSQTPFQLMHNFHPEPAKAIVMNLRTGEWRIKDFLK